MKQGISKMTKNFKNAKSFREYSFSQIVPPKLREENKKLVDECKERKGKRENVNIFRGSVRVFPAHRDQSGDSTAPVHAGSGSSQPYSNLNKNINVNTLKVPYVQSSVGSTVNKVNFLAHQSRRLRGAYRIGSCLSSSSVV